LFLCSMVAICGGNTGLPLHGKQDGSGLGFARIAGRCSHSLHGGPDFLGRLHRSADKGIFGISVQGDQAIAMLAIDLEAITNFARALPENPFAARAPQLYLVVNHDNPNE
jgi:hypothetical protein